MFLRLLLLFTIVPAVELYLLITIGQWIGPLATVAIIVFTGMLGAAMAKREGLAVLRSVQVELGQGQAPAGRLVEGLLVLIGGVLLLTPGILTDIMGFTLILPWTRPHIARFVGERLRSRFVLGGAEFNVGEPGPGPAQPQRVEPGPKKRREPGGGGGFDHPVV